MKKRGISLIVLVITIIVIIILAVAVILSIANNNPIENAKKAAFQNDIATLKEELDLYIQKQYVDSQGTYNVSDLNKSGEDIKDILPDIKDKYIGKIAINGGSLEYTDESNMQEYNWANETLTGEKLNYDKAVSSDSKNMQINNAIAGKLGNLRIYGNSIQNGTPTPDNPVEIQSVGDFVTEGEYKDNYRIPITVSGKNLWTTDITYPVTAAANGKEVINYDSNTQTYILDEASASTSKSVYTLKNPIPAGTKVTVYMYILEGNIGGTIVFGGYHVGDTNSWQGNINLKSYENEDLSGKVLKNTYVTTDTVTDFWAFLYTGYRINSSLKFKIMYKIGDDENDEFEPYTSTTTNIYLKEPLRKVGDAVDYIDLKNKKVVRNVKEIVLNGTEGWSNMSGNAPYKLTLNDRENEYKNNLRILSNSFETVNNMVSWVGYDSMISVSSMYPKDIVFRYTKIDSLENFKSYLNNNNPKLLYVLSSPEEKVINPLEEISTINGINNISIGTSINPSKIEAVYSKEK